MILNSEFCHHGRFGRKRLRSDLLNRYVGNVYMVGMVSRHELIACEASEADMDDRPLERDQAPAAFRLCFRQANSVGKT